MAERSRPDELGIFRWIVSRLSPRTKLLVGAIAVLAVAARLLAIAAAWLFVENDTRGAFIVAAVSAGAFVVRRAVTASARIDAESDLHLAASRAVLESDVIEEPEVEPHFALTNGLYYAVEGVTGSLPALAADLAGALAAVVALAATLGRALSTGLVIVGCAAVVVVAGMTLLVRRRIAILHEGAIAAQQGLGDALATALHGRLEIVASANEPATLDRVAAAAAAYRRYAKRAAFGAAVIGRAPLGAALVLCVVALGVEQGSRSWVALAPSAALVAASLPPIMGVVFGSQELLRLTKRLAPFGRIVLRPIRPELTRREAPSRGSTQMPRPFTLDRVGFRYHDGAPLVLESLDASWMRGVLVLRGPNGCGKSTALRLLVGLREPTSGQVRLDDVDLREIDLDGVRARVAYLPQRPYLGESYATLEEAFRVVAPEVTPDEARRALARVGLEAQLAHRASDLLTLTVGELSVGQRQRLALARVLVREADVVLLDEPDANLDSAGLDLLVDIVHELEQRGCMIAVAAHGPIAAKLRGSAWEFGDKTVRQR